MKNIIVKIEKLFKTGFFHIFGSSVINKCLGFLSNIILVRLLTKSEYGQFTYAWNIYSMVIILNGIGADAAIVQLCSEHSGDEKYARKISNFGARYGSFSCVVLGVILLFVAFFVPLKIQNANEILALLCALPFMQFLYNLFLVYLRSQKRNQEYSNLSIINTALHLLLSVAGALLFREKGLVFGYYISYLIACLIGVFSMRLQIFSQELCQI